MKSPYYPWFLYGTLFAPFYPANKRSILTHMNVLLCPTFVTIKYHELFVILSLCHMYYKQSIILSWLFSLNIIVRTLITKSFWITSMHKIYHLQKVRGVTHTDLRKLNPYMMFHRHSRKSQGKKWIEFLGSNPIYL